MGDIEVVKQEMLKKLRYIYHLGAGYSYRFDKYKPMLNDVREYANKIVGLSREVRSLEHKDEVIAITLNKKINSAIKKLIELFNEVENE